MSDDDILAIVAALEFVTSREAPIPQSRWKLAAREFEDDDPESGWKSSS